MFYWLVEIFIKDGIAKDEHFDSAWFDTSKEAFAYINDCLKIDKFAEHYYFKLYRINHVKKVGEYNV